MLGIMGLIELIQKGLGIEIPEFKPMKIGNYSFEGKLIANERISQRFRGEYSSCKLSSSLLVYQTRGNKYVIHADNERVKVAENEEELLNLIKKIRLMENQGILKAEVSRTLYGKGLESFKELIPKPRELVHVD